MYIVIALMKIGGNLIIKRKYVIKEVFFFKNMANRRGLVLKILGGLLFPFVVLTYGEFILIY